MATVYPIQQLTPTALVGLQARPVTTARIADNLVLTALYHPGSVFTAGMLCRVYQLNTDGTVTAVGTDETPLDDYVMTLARADDGLAVRLRLPIGYGGAVLTDVGWIDAGMTLQVVSAG